MKITLGFQIQYVGFEILNAVQICTVVHTQDDLTLRGVFRVMALYFLKKHALDSLVWLDKGVDCAKGHKILRLVSTFEDQTLKLRNLLVMAIIFVIIFAKNCIVSIELYK